MRLPTRPFFIVSCSFVPMLMLFATIVIEGCNGANECGDALCVPDFGLDANLDSLIDIGQVVEDAKDTTTADGYHSYSGSAVITPDKVHFGAKVGVVRLASVTITNTGAETLTIRRVHISNQEHPELGIYEVIENPDFMASCQSEPVDSEIKPNDSADIKISYLKIKPNIAGPSARLIIESSALNSVIYVPLDEARPGNVDLCTLELQPLSLDLGLVPVGVDKEFSMSFVNTSQGACTVNAIKILDCPNEASENACPAQPTSETSIAFQAKAIETIVGALIEPGAELSFHLNFTSSELEAEPTTVSALLVYEIVDALGIHEIWPQCGFIIGDECKPNLTATTY